MALITTVRVNDDKPLAHVVMIRLAGDTQPDSVNTYRYEVWQRAEQTHRGDIQHRYGDGALSLLAKVLKECEF